MLSHLYISQYALIDNIDIDFNDGMSVITGSSGAGKSIILGALSLIMGDRADTRVIRHGAQKCVVEATFSSVAENVKNGVKQLDIDVENELIIRREVAANGRSRAFVNDTPVALTDLRPITELLVDIHSQHQNMLARDLDFQLSVIDTIADNGAILEDYSACYQAYTKAKSELNNLKEFVKKATAERDYNIFQFEQLDSAKLQEGEQEELENEQRFLSHAQQVIELSQIAYSALDNDQTSALSLVKNSLQSLKKASQYKADYEPDVERLDSLLIELRDIAATLEDKLNSLEFDPNRQAFVDERLNTIYTLEHKHNVSTVEQLIEIKNDYQTKLEQLDNFDNEIAQAEKKVDSLYKSLCEKGVSLTKSRKAVIGQVEESISQSAQYLGIKYAKIVVKMEQEPDFTPCGIDKVTFLFSANKNCELNELAAVASGGEISRLMLSIKQLLASKRALPTIIFDEIDTGISGLIASRVADAMKSLSANIQLITITHLPQIAAKGDSHYRVYKEDETQDTFTKIALLDEQQRRYEIAEMISGDKLADAALAAADELLKG